MNKILFSEGGQPLNLDDLEFMQNSVHNPMKALLSSWGNCILSGCQIQVDKETSAHSWTAGYISYNGEVYAVSAGSIEQVEQSASLYWMLYSSEGGSRSFSDGSAHPTQKVYTARLAPMRQAPESGDYLADDGLPRLGFDFMRPPRLKYSYEGSGEVVNFTELSPYSGVLTLKIDGALPMNGYFALFKMAGVNNSQGSVSFSSIGSSIATITLTNGKLMVRESDPDISRNSHTGIGGKKHISILITWDYDEDNSQGAGINEASGTDYRGVGRSGFGRGRR